MHRTFFGIEEEKSGALLTVLLRKNPELLRHNKLLRFNKFSGVQPAAKTPLNR